MQMILKITEHCRQVLHSTKVFAKVLFALCNFARKISGGPSSTVFNNSCMRKQRVPLTGACCPKSWISTHFHPCSRDPPSLSMVFGCIDENVSERFDSLKNRACSSLYHLYGAMESSLEKMAFSKLYIPIFLHHKHTQANECRLNTSGKFLDLFTNIHTYHTNGIGKYHRHSPCNRSLNSGQQNGLLYLA